MFKLRDRIMVVKGSNRGKTGFIDALFRGRATIDTFRDRILYRSKKGNGILKKSVRLENLRHVNSEGTKTGIYRRRMGRDYFRFYKVDRTMVYGDVYSRIVNRRRILSKFMDV